MAIIPNSQQFHTLSSSVDTTERGSARANANRESYTMQDIKDTIPAATSINELSDASAGGGTEATGTVINLGTKATWSGPGGLGYQGGQSVVLGFKALEVYNTTVNTANNFGRHISIGYKSNNLRDGSIHAWNAFAIGNYAAEKWNPSSAVNQIYAIGNLSMANTINATDCIAIGPQSLQSLGNFQDTVADPNANRYNIYVGGYTGWMRGKNNVSVGWQIGPSYSTAQNTTPADSNTMIGHQAGQGNSGGGTSGTYAVQNVTCLGAFSKTSTFDATNEITLGDSNITALRCNVTTITSLSDERDKKDIADLDKGLDTVMNLKPRKFIWNNRPEQRIKDITPAEIDEEGQIIKDSEIMYEEVNSTRKGAKDIGFIAQELQAVDDEFMQLVFDKNPDKLEASYGRLIPVLVKAIQELKAELDLLK
tara:strand:- start:874 stop:2142 length:1269 start_codon:yes stop_codon:yes gene_type:complete